MEPELSESEKALRDFFVVQYLKDFDPFQACLRVGFQAAFAVEYAKKFMQESYVQLKISEGQRSTPKNEEERTKELKELATSVLVQASQNGPYASRVAAVRELKSMYGWEKGVEEEDKETSLIEALRQFAQNAPV
jgi:ABC-type enterochelin transport system substrate-binding protein